MENHVWIPVSVNNPFNSRWYLITFIDKDNEAKLSVEKNQDDK